MEQVSINGEANQVETINGILLALETLAQNIEELRKRRFPSKAKTAAKKKAKK